MKTAKNQFVVCVCNDGLKVSLELRKVYRVVAALKGDPPESIRVIDETGEDYLFSRDWFVPVTVPPRARGVLNAAIEHVSS